MALALILSFSPMYAEDIRITMAQKFWDEDDVQSSYIEYINFFFDEDCKSIEDILCAKIGQACCEYYIFADDITFDRQLKYYLFNNEMLKNNYILDYVTKNTPIEECLKELLKSNQPIFLRNLIYE